MKPLRLLACAGIILISLPVSGGADELTDALVPTDPRTKLESGTGRAYHSRYTPAEDQPSALHEEPELLATPRLRYERSGDLYKGLRSPLYESPAGEEDPFSTSVTLPPLGKPHQRPGVWYQDDLNR